MRGQQRVFVATQRGVGSKYIPINRYLDDISLTVVPNGATFSVDYTMENIIRAPSFNELDGSDVNDPANAIWTNVGALTNNAIRAKLNAYAIRLAVSATTGGTFLAAIAEDGGVFTDETALANSAAANDMTLFPVAPVAGVDRYNFGFDIQQGSFSLNVGTAGVGTYTATWQYWNGAAWVALAGVADGTNSFKTAGVNTVSWTIPADWQKANVGGKVFYFVRAEFTAGTSTTIPAGTQAFDLLAPTTIRIAQG